MEDTGNYSNEYYEDYYGYWDNYFNYTYSYESSDWLPLNELVPSVTFYSLIGLLGIAGNVLVIVAILTFPRMKNITNVFLLSLASADLLLVLICVPIKCTAFFTYTWQIGGFLCTFVAYIQNVSMVCSVMTLTVMSIERFVAILYPLRARSVCTMKHAKIVTILIWIASFIIALPTVFVQKLKEVGNDKVTAHWCVKQFLSHGFEIAYEIYMFVILFTIPLSVMLVTYIRISLEIWDVVSKRAVLRSGSEYSYTSTTPSNGGMKREASFLNQSSSRASTKSAPITYNEDAKTRKQVILMLMVIVVLFAICWGPILLNNLLVAFKVIDNLHTGILKPMRMAFHLMSYANSCVNPIVYGIMSKNFQDSLKSVLKCFKSPQTYRTYVYSTDTTRASILKSTCSNSENGCIEMT
ncbi:QRFP-like peptide receptor isoform X2 [Saccostrea echinata]|uniref:QRFP-like peptide receptor isoform X2 n=1 Tax=Saccostrea echinata TaxID=191078 RepID=UPI002A81615C|nr:QRFP-like peptide receptor isoform X2 [Saccostrea echinata]